MASMMYEVFTVDPPGLEVGVDEVLEFEEGQRHLLGPGRMNLGLEARLVLWQPLMGLLFVSRVWKDTDNSS
jgi:hypothetical protein